MKRRQLEQVIKRLAEKNMVIRSQEGVNSKSMIFLFCWGYEEALKDIATFFEVDWKLLKQFTDET